MTSLSTPLHESAHDRRRKSSESGASPLHAKASRFLERYGANEETMDAVLLQDIAQEEFKEKWNKGVVGLRNLLKKRNTFASTHSPEQAEKNRVFFACSVLEEDVRVLVITLIEEIFASSAMPMMANAKFRRERAEFLSLCAKLADRCAMTEVRDILEEQEFLLLDTSAHDRRTEERLHESKRTEQCIADIRSVFSDTTHADILLVPEEPTWQEKRSGAEASLAAKISIVCSDIASCYGFLGMLHFYFQQKIGTVADLIATPSINGYQGLHTVILLEDGREVSCAIRTPDMQTYARHGIASVCFDEDVIGSIDYLPWAKRIPMLLEESAGDTALFLTMLKDDVLCPHIAVHAGKNDVTFLPAHGTALDAALLCKQEQALWLHAVSVNGREAGLADNLANGASISFQWDARRTVDRRWLWYVRTFAARFLIRTALGKTSPVRQLAAGKNLLQYGMHKRKLGFLEEFDLRSLNARAKEAGYPAFDEACMLLARGGADPEELCVRLFERQGGKNALRPFLSRMKMMTAIIFIIIAWCLDPVLTKSLLSFADVTPAGFTFLRFVGFFGLCSVVTWGTSWKMPVQLKKLSWDDPSLWGAAASLFVFALTTYTSLSMLLPQEYITFAYASALLFPALHFSLPSRPSGAVRIASVLLACCVPLLIHFVRPDLPASAPIYGLLLMGSFALYTIFVDAFKRRQRVLARIPHFLFALSVLTLCFSALLLPLAGLRWSWHVPLVLLYTIGVVGIPHLLFYLLLSTTSIQKLARYFAAGTLLTLGGQHVTLGMISLPSLLPLLLTFAAIAAIDTAYLYPATTCEEASTTPLPVPATQ